ncbi:MAG: 50S ribosomal protein L18 [bacterium]
MISRSVLRKSRHRRVRKKIFGTKSHPRLCVYRSLRHTYAQIVDDQRGRTIVAASTLSPEVKKKIEKLKKSEAAAVVGELIVERSKTKGIKRVAFDKSGYDYHGRVKSLAEACRRGGLKF